MKEGIAMFRSVEYAAQGHAAMLSAELASQSEVQLYVEAMNCFLTLSFWLEGKEMKVNNTFQ
jgi:hypothetical protein